MKSPDEQTTPPQDNQGLVARLYRGIIIGLQVLMAVEFCFLVYRGQWQSAFLLLVITAITIGPIALRRWLTVTIPAELHLLVVAFVFAALFLGEIRNYYERIWWWDIVLHGGSGLLLGILGFLLVYVLNENDRVDLHMRPRFVALFAFVFAVAIGALWEIFEFGMDQLFGLNMQKPMFGDDSGLTDTMWDLIVDTLGAAIISGLGWWHMHYRRASFIEIWIRKFVDHNPQLFEAGRRRMRRWRARRRRTAGHR